MKIIFGNISQKLNDYYNQIPSDTLPTMARSAVFSFIAATIIQGFATLSAPNHSITRFKQPLISAGLATLASLIHALFTPIFTAIFGNDNQITFHQECAKMMIILPLVALTVYYGTFQKVDIIANQYLRSLPPLSPSLNLFKSTQYLTVQAINYVCSYHLTPAQLRSILQRLGLDTPDGANNTYIFV